MWHNYPTAQGPSCVCHHCSELRAGTSHGVSHAGRIHRTSNRCTTGQEEYNTAEVEYILKPNTCKKKVSKPCQFQQIALLSSQSYHDLSLLRATALPTAWEKLNSSEPAHPRVQSTPQRKDLSQSSIQARLLVGIMLWRTGVFTELPIVVNMDFEKKKKSLTAF